MDDLADQYLVAPQPPPGMVAADAAASTVSASAVPISAPQTLTLAEAADLARVSKRTLYRAARAGSGPFYKVGAQWRVDASELRAWMRTRQDRSAAKPRGVLGEVMELRAGAV